MKSVGRRSINPAETYPRIYVRIIVCIYTQLNCYVASLFVVFVYTYRLMSQMNTEHQIRCDTLQTGNNETMH